MERLFKIRIFTVMFFLAVASIAANAKESKKEGDNYHAKQILIAASVKNGDCKFIPANATQVTGQVLNEIKVNGESEDCYSDLSAVPTEELQKVLDNAGADYLLVLNQHYLKWQDQPLRTLFHIVSYTLFDKDKNEVYRGNNFFTCMNLENPDKLRKSSRKSSSKIASSIIKTLDED